MKKWTILLLSLLILVGTVSCAKPVNSTDSEDPLALNTTYENAEKLFLEQPERHRDIGERQSETQEILLIEGKYYQSYVSSVADIRYVFVSSSEYDMTAIWDWQPVGTKDSYSIDLLGQIPNEYQ